MKRPSYHHGDLANALTEAAMHLAREGGPDAVVLREAARKVGVSATAAYRHFASHADLMHAVKHVALEKLAASMNVELSRTAPLPEPGPEALRRLRALGIGYLRFATEEPGLFRTAFCNPVVTAPDLTQDRASPAATAAPNFAEVDPFRMLGATVDQLVAAGLLAPHRRPGADIFAWSAVHGLAVLLIDGPLKALPPSVRDQAIESTLTGVEASLTR